MSLIGSSNGLVTNNQIRSIAILVIIVLTFTGWWWPPAPLPLSKSVAMPSQPSAMTPTLSLPVTSGNWHITAVYRELPKPPPPGLSKFSEDGIDWYGQVEQDATVANILGYRTGGFFVDMAANEALVLSNTFSFEHFFSWDGLCIEANPVVAQGHFAHRRCALVQAAVGSTDGEQVVFDFRDGSGIYGGLVGQQFDNVKDSRTSRTLTSVSVETIFRDFKVPPVIDYLNLDLEGAEWFAFQHFPWSNFTFLAITVERPSFELRDDLHSHGYIFLCDNGDFGESV